MGRAGELLVGPAQRGDQRDQRDDAEERERQENAAQHGHDHLEPVEAEPAPGTTSIRAWPDSHPASSRRCYSEPNPAARLIRSSERSLPSSAIDSKSGGEIRVPVTAARTGWKALRAESPRSSWRARISASIAGVAHSSSFSSRSATSARYRSCPAIIFRARWS